ncbi:hypothetical protein DMH26_01930 [Streptomyces sp. WAC 05379]|nr:hypothetical protein DMH26_01930 [Streptomyces sp. WAC 05379]
MLDEAVDLQQPAADAGMIESQLSVISQVLDQYGERPEVTYRAYEIVRRLGSRQEGPLERQLSDVLTTLGVELMNHGRLDEALTTTQRTLEIQHRLSAAEPFYKLAITGTLSILTTVTSALGRWPEALAYAQEAVARHRELEQMMSPAPYPGFPQALANLSLVLTILERWSEALDTTDEAIVAFEEPTLHGVETSSQHTLRDLHERRDYILEHLQPNG